METWKPINGYPNYEVSDLGRVRSKGFVRHIVRGNAQYDLEIPGRIIKPLQRKHGYLSVFLYTDKSRKQYSVHRLVAEAFCEKADGKTEVNHINEDKTDNRACNLEWVTHKENCHYGTAIQRRSEKRRNGEKSTPVAQYTLDGEYIKTYPSIGEVYRQTGFAQGNIHKAMNGRYKHAYGYKWQYDTLHINE